MPPTGASVASSSGVDTVQMFVSRNPALFYAVVGFCCVSVTCGIAYLTGRALGRWRWNGAKLPRTVNNPSDVPTCAQERTSLYDLWKRLYGNTSQHARLRSPVVEDGHVPTASNWAAHHVSRCRSVDIYALPIPDVATATSQTPEPNYAYPPPVYTAAPAYASPGDLKLVGLGLGTIPFIPCDIEVQANPTHIVNCSAEAFDEIDITEHSYSIYSQASFDSFSLYVPIYDDVPVHPGPSPIPVFIIGSPSPGTLSPALKADLDVSISSLEYLRQETSCEYSPQLAVNNSKRDEISGHKALEKEDTKPKAGKVREEDKENVMVPL